MDSIEAVGMPVKLENRPVNACEESFTIGLWVLRVAGDFLTLQ